MSYIKEWDAEHQLRHMTGEVLEPVQCYFNHYTPEIAAQTNVVDAGCGAGTNTLWLSSKGFKVFAFDSSNAAISRLLSAATANSRRNFPMVMCCDMTKRWPYRDSSIDVVLDVRSMENLDDGELINAHIQAGRVLKRGGMFLSLAASDERDDALTTVGKVYKLTDRQVFDRMSFSGLNVECLMRQDALLHDWWIAARKR